MNKNVGRTDKIIRYFLALVFVYLGYNYSVWWYVVSAILVLTATLGYCGPYKLFGINTNK